MIARTNKERMLLAVLSDSTLIEKYGYDLDDFEELEDFEVSPNPVVKAVYSIIFSVDKNDESEKRFTEIYKSIFKNLSEEI